MFRQRHRRIVARLHDHSLDQILDTDLRADVDKHARTFLRARMPADGDHVVSLMRPSLSA